MSLCHAPFSWSLTIFSQSRQKIQMLRLIRHLIVANICCVCKMWPFFSRIIIYLKSDTDTDTFISEHGENPVNTNKNPEALKVSNTIG